MKKKELNYSIVQQVMKKKGYLFFEGPLNVNIIGIRSKNLVSGWFDDFILLLYLDSSLEPVIKIYEATTDPGREELMSPSFPEAQKNGTAIMVPGQYRKAYSLGYHGSGKYRHKALLQVAPIKLYRDNNRNAILDMTINTPITEGYYGIRIHKALGKNVDWVHRWSAGCQVLDPDENYDEFISIIEESAKHYGNLFTYTLLEEKDFS